MAIDWEVAVKAVLPVLGGLVTLLVKRWAESRPRVVAYLQHTSSVALAGQQGQPPLNIGTHSVVLRNAGRRPAKNVRLGHNTLPAFRIFPDVEYTVATLPAGSSEIRIPVLVPKKQLTITYLYFAPLTWDQVNTHLETDDGPIKVLNVIPQVRPPRWLQTLLWLLVAVGLSTLIYLGYVALLS